MGWVWRDDGGDEEKGRQMTSRDSGRYEPPSLNTCVTTKVYKTECKTEEVEPGKFVKKCEKTEEFLRDCIGKPAEVIRSNKVYTEEDVTDEVQRGGSSIFDTSGLQNDFEVFERNFFGGFSRIFDAAQEMMKKELSDAFARAPRIFDGGSSSMRRGVPIEEFPRQEASSKSQPKGYGSIDDNLSGLARDV